MICVGVPLWDRQVSAETNVEDTLWLCLACAIGVLVTVGVETQFFTDQTRGGHRRGRRGPSCLRRELVSVFRERLPRRPINASNCSAPGHGRNIHVAAHLTTVCLSTELCRTNGSSDRSYGKTSRSRRQSNESRPDVCCGSPA